MTREEAIENLKEFIDTYITCHGEEDTIAVSLDNVDVEAFDMAIKALEQEPRKDEVILTKEEYGELVSSEFDNGYSKGYREALEQEPTTKNYSSELEKTRKNSKKLEKNFGELDCISRADALRVAKNEYLRGWHNALCKALREKYSIHCEEGNFSVIQEETITGLGLSMNCAAGKDVESYISTIPRVTPIRPKGHWFVDERPESDREVICSNCEQTVFKYHKLDFDYRPKYCPNCGADMGEVEE